MSYSVTTETVTATTVVVPEYISGIATSIVEASEKSLELIKQLPGGDILISYIRYSYQDDPYRSLFELALFIFAIRYFLKSKSSYSKKDYVKLSNKEIDELVSDWQPDPLVLPVSEKEEWQLQTNSVLTGECALHSTVLDKESGEHKEVINLASLDYLDITSHPKMKEDAIKQMGHSGVGACGPPNFYGTQDVHRKLEDDLASYFGAEQGILYAQDFCTAPSIIPCFLKRGDFAVVDGGVNLAIQQAIKISRCEVYWYDHNDMSSLETVMKELTQDLKDEELTRRFVITEALFENYGDVADLAKIIEIKNRYKFRLILDESRSIGVLGKTGRGLVEHCDVDRKDVNVTIGSLSQALGSSGGFCIGESPMINHQKIQSNAYVFSAALPPYCAKVGSTAIGLIKESSSKTGESALVGKLHANKTAFFSAITSNKIINQLFEITSTADSPTVHLRLQPRIRESMGLPPKYGGLGSEIWKAASKGTEEGFFDADFNYENRILQLIVDKLIDDGVLITRSQRILHHEILPMIPELLFNVKATLTRQEIDQVIKTFAKDANSILKAKKFPFSR